MEERIIGGVLIQQVTMEDAWLLVAHAAFTIVATGSSLSQLSSSLTVILPPLANSSSSDNDAARGDGVTNNARLCAHCCCKCQWSSSLSGGISGWRPCRCRVFTTPASTTLHATKQRCRQDTPPLSLLPLWPGSCQQEEGEEGSRKAASTVLLGTITTR